jgi:hypothetical protein
LCKSFVLKSGGPVLAGRTIRIRRDRSSLQRRFEIMHFPGWKWLLFPVLGTLLSGCFDDQERVLSQCELAGRRAFAHEDLETGPRLEEYIVGCMRNAGYDWSLLPGRCAPKYQTVVNPYCYEPQGWMARLSYKTELALGR